MNEQVTNVKELVDAIELNSPVAVELTDDKSIHPEFRGQTIYGFFVGVSANPKVNAAIRDEENGWHWLAHVVDPRNDNLVYDVHLAIITTIDVAPEQVQKEREL